VQAIHEAPSSGTRCGVRKTAKLHYFEKYFRMNGANTDFCGRGGRVVERNDFEGFWDTARSAGAQKTLSSHMLILVAILYYCARETRARERFLLSRIAVTNQPAHIVPVLIIHLSI